MFMSNFTQDERPACRSSFVMNLTSCCSKLLKQSKNNMLSFLLPMFLLFSVSTLQAQKLQTDQERSVFYEVCLSQAPEGFTEEQVEAMVEAAFNCSKLQVTKNVVTVGDDCFWESFHSFTIEGFDECEGISDVIKYYYQGGDRTAPELTGTLPPSVDNINLCFSMIPPGPTAEQIGMQYTDNCGGPIMVTKTGEPTEDSDDCSWEVTYTYVIKDECGNTVEPEVKITYTGGDSSAPTLIGEIPADQDSLNQCFLDKEQGPTEAEIAALFTDNCTTITEANVVKQENSKGNDCKWLAVYTYTVTDNCGNSYPPFEIMYSGGDYEAPVLDPAPANTTISCIDEFNPQAIPALGWTDNCAGEGTAPGIPDFSGLGLPCAGGEVVIRWNYTDPCLNPAEERVQVITVLPAPQAQFPPVENTSILCENLDSYVPPVLTVSNNLDSMVCLIEAEVEGTWSFDENCGTFTVSYSYTDACGRESTTSFDVEVIDNTPPSIEAPAAFKAECDEEWAFGDPTFSDNCDENPTLEIVSTVENLDDCGLGTVTRTWKATDSCGNSATDSQTVYIEDNTNPTIEAGSAFKVECDQEIVWPEPDFSDNCDDKPELTIVSTVANLDEDCYTGTVTRTWKVTDCAGNTATDSQTVYIEDNTDPTITAADPKDVQCDEEWSFDTPEFADNCDENPTLMIVGEDVADLNDCGLGTITRTWKVSDCAGNTATASQTVTILDSTDPTITAPDDFTVECDQEYAFGQPEFGDNCDENPVLSEPVDTPDLDECGLGTVTRTWTVTDCAGNTATASQTVTIVDTTAPVFTSVPEDLLLECDEEAPVEMATAVDNCDSDVTVTYADYDFYTPWKAFVSGDGSVDLTTTPDGFVVTGSNQGTFGTPWLNVAFTTVKAMNISFDFDYVNSDDFGGGWDDLVAIVNGEIVASLTDSTNGIGSFDLQAGDVFAIGIFNPSDDCCGGATVTVSNLVYTPAELECPITNCFIREYTATDCAGNSSYASQFIFFQDTTAPELSGVGESFTIECPEAPVFSEPTATDNCDAEPVITFADDDKRDECGLGTITRTWTATDACGNTSNASQTITIEDNEAPVISGVGESFSVECPEEWAFSEPTASDACDNGGDNSINFNASAPFLAFMDVNGPSGSFAQGWGVADAVAIVNTGDNTLTLKPNRVNDTGPFWFTNPTDLFGEKVMTASTFVQDESLANTAFTFVGNVSGFSLDSDYAVTVFIRVFQAGFSNLLEISAPISSTGDFSVTYDGAYEGAAIVQYGFQMVGANVNPGAEYNADYDALGSVVITAASLEESPYPTLTFADQDNRDECGLGSITRTWTATDCAGNTSNASQTITIFDNTAPEITGVGEPFTVECPEEWAFSEPTASDLCDLGGDTGGGNQSVTENFDGLFAPTLFVDQNTPTNDYFSSPYVSMTAGTWEVLDNSSFDCPLLSNPNSLTWNTDCCTSNNATISFTTPASNVGFTIAGNTELQVTVNHSGGSSVYNYNGNGTTGNAISLTETDITSIDLLVVSGFAGCLDELSFSVNGGGSSVTLTFADDDQTDDCGLGTITRTWTATDCAGNTANASQTVTIIDITAPVITEVGESFSVECPEEWAFSEPVVSDTCDEEPSLTFEDDDKRDECGLGTITRNWLATDCAGNTATASQTITIFDDTAPEITGVGESFSVECPEEWAFSEPTASDACNTGGISFKCYFSETNNQTGDVDFTGSTGQDAGGYDIFPGGTSNIPGTYSLAFNSNLQRWEVIYNSQLVLFVSTVTSTSPSCDMADWSPLDTSCVLLEVTCLPGSPVSLTFEDDDKRDECGLGTITRTWTATDCAGNTSNASQTVTIFDNTPPVFNEELPGPVTYECHEVEPMAVLTATDACDPEVEVVPTEVRTDGNCPNNYTLTRTWKVSDCAGNTAEHVQIVTVQDTTAPTLKDGAELPEGESNLNLCYDQMPEGPSESDIALLYEDNCGVVMVWKDSKPLGDDCDWAVMYTYTVKDDCGNELEPFKIYYNGGDTEAPQLNDGFSYPDPITGIKDCKDFAHDAPKADDYSGYFSDNCGSVTIGDPVMDMTGDDCSWTITYTMTVVDDCDNYADPIVVSYSGGDDMAPEYQGGLPTGENQLNLCFDETYEGLGEPTEAEVALLFTDNCAELTAENITKIRKEYTDEENPNCSWIVVFEYYATDACGNSSEILKVNYQGGDTEAPSQDNCVNETMTLKTSNGFACPAEAGFSLSVGDYIYADDNTWSVAGVPLSQIGTMVPCFSDNCTANEDIKYTVTAVDTPDFGGVDVCQTTMTITFDVSDECGNTFYDFVCTFIIIDDEAPIIECPTEVVDLGSNPELDANGIPTAVATKLGAYDECQGQVDADFDPELDEIASSTIQEFNSFSITCQFSDGSTAISAFTEILGFDDNGKAIFATGSVNTAQEVEMAYNYTSMRWEVQLPGANFILWDSSANDSAYPSCDLADWADNNTNCTIIGVDCDFTDTTDWSLDRTFIANDGCNNTSECVVSYIWTTGEDNSSQSSQPNNSSQTETIEEPLTFKAYPVPFDKEVTISYDFNYDTDVKVELFDTKGILIKDLSANRHLQGTTSKTTIEMSGMPNQMYYVKVTTNRGSVTKKIISKQIRR